MNDQATRTLGALLYEDFEAARSLRAARGSAT
jgi:hypothetical protein